MKKYFDTVLSSDGSPVTWVNVNFAVIKGAIS